MARIRSLKPNVTRDEAIAQFARSRVSGFVRNAAFGPLRSVAEFYIPFHLFQVEIFNRGRRDSRFFGLDGVNGSLDLYHFEHLPGPEDVIVLETRNCLPAVLDHALAEELMIAKVRRLIFSTGFFRIRHLRISAERIPGEIHIPYWVGFRGHVVRARFAVLDAVRRQIEGAKVRRLLESWLTSLSQ
jgi:hypothetical protein